MSKEEEGENQDEVYERIKNSRFKQQNLPAWRPVPTIGSTTVIFMSLGIIFVALGIIILVYANKIIEKKVSYSDKCDKIGQNCSVDFRLEKDMKKDIMVYYQLDNFYQNHRRYVKSKNDDQLKGKEVKEKTLKDDCKYALTNKEMNKTKNFDGSKILKEKDIAIPCGLIAKSFFNDNFSIALNNKKNGNCLIKFDDNKKIPIDETNIAWSADKKNKYKNSKNPSKQWINMEDEHFIVWMRPAALPNFRKLWGRIKEDLKPGNYTLYVDNIYDVERFKGKKYIILSNINQFGGKNKFLGICYIIVGGISIILSIVFIIGYSIHQKKEKEE